MSQIYISSACIKSTSIEEVIKQLNEMGFWNIELSGGTIHEPEIETILLKHALGKTQFLLHNYFPIPSSPMVLNSGSLDAVVSKWSGAHIAQALQLSKALHASHFAFHAPFRMAIPVDKIGKKVPKFELYPTISVWEAFKNTLKHTQDLADQLGIELYVENNVYSAENYEVYGNDLPFFFLTANDFETMAEHVKMKPLLDVAHLKVSCKTLGLDFYSNLKRLIEITDYIHISDNDGLADSNRVFSKNSELYDMLSDFDLSDRTLTLETYVSQEELIESYETLLNLV